MKRLTTNTLTESLTEKKTAPFRLLGVDSIRFIMALWVVISHLGLPKFAIYQESNNLIKIFQSFGDAFANGSAAVIVFFLVSGLCIHFPARTSLVIPCLKAFYIRRIIRIVIPAIVAIFFAGFIGNIQKFMIGNGGDDVGILWSLIAELIYYLLYPLILMARRKYSWLSLIFVSFIVATILAMTNVRAGNYPSFGNALNWILGLPCWLLGCLLAEQVESSLPVTKSQVLCWRCLIFGFSIIAVVLRWYLPHELTIGYPWSLNVFAIVAFYWLKVEITRSRQIAPLPWLESAGHWSYSLYLMHPVMIFAVQFAPQLALPRFIFLYGGALLLAYIFYLICERPSQNLAVRWSRKMASVG